MVNYITENFELHARSIPSQTEGMQVYYSPNLTYVDSGLSCDTFNIIHINNRNALTGPELVAALTHFRQKDFAYCIWVSAENLMEPVRQLFDKAGVTEQNQEVGMVLDLSSYQPILSDLHQNARFAETHQHVADYAQVIAANWSPPDQHVVTYFQQTADHYLTEDNKTLLAIYYADGKPVSTIELFPTDDETIGFYSLATLSDTRGRGIGSALLSFALNKAKTLGYRRAILQASDDGIRIYQRLGFEVVTMYYEFA